MAAALQATHASAGRMAWGTSWPVAASLLRYVGGLGCGQWNPRKRNVRAAGVSECFSFAWAALGLGAAGMDGAKPADV